MSSDCKSQFDCFRKKIDLDFIKMSSGRFTGCSTTGISREDPDNQVSDAQLQEVIKRVREEMNKMREDFSAELAEQSEKHLERERHLSEQILSYQTEMAT